jgi:hypothetical protein
MYRHKFILVEVKYMYLHYYCKIFYFLFFIFYNKIFNLIKKLLEIKFCYEKLYNY